MTEINIIKIDGKPLEKLIGVISKGIGKLYKPTEIRKEADAKAYEITVIEAAKSKAKSEDKQIEHETLCRIEERMVHRETKRQKNIDNINYIAAKQLSQEETVSDEPVDEDWINRFFRIAEDVSNDEMQALWGRILAGEVKQPKTYSIRTLELLKNISKEEAEVFTKLGRLALTTSSATFIFDPDKGSFHQSEYGITFSDKLLLSEIGLISSKDNLEITFPAETKGEEYTMPILYGKKAILLTKKAGAPAQKIQVIVFSKAGAQLVNLLDNVYEEKYFNKLCQALKHEKVNVRYADVVVENGDANLINEKDFV